MCRARAGDCDVAEACDGVSTTCPMDQLVAANTVCRLGNGDCDEIERCTGTSPQCPTDVFAPATLVCRSAANSCDVAENCPGTNPICPVDLFQPATVVCAAQTCTAGVTTPARYCAGTSATCQTVTSVSCNGYQCNGTTCRTACSTGADCLGTHFCQLPGNQCSPKRADGVACTSPTTGYECLSGACTGSYADGDGDGFGAGALGYFCGANPPSGRSSNNTDCCDTDNRAKPGGTFQTTARVGCGGYDFDCVGGETQQYAQGNACATTGTCGGSMVCPGAAGNETGWQGATPSCGTTATYVTACASTIVTGCAAGSVCGMDPGLCSACQRTTTSRTQGCR